MFVTHLYNNIIYIYVDIATPQKNNKSETHHRTTMLEILFYPFCKHVYIYNIYIYLHTCVYIDTVYIYK